MHKPEPQFLFFFYLKIIATQLHKATLPTIPSADLLYSIIHVSTDLFLQHLHTDFRLRLLSVSETWLHINTWIEPNLKKKKKNVKMSYVFVAILSKMLSDTLMI